MIKNKEDLITVLLSLGIYTKEEIESRSLSFQHYFDAIENALKLGKPVTFGQVVTCQF